jgi:hypothetical protein
MKVRYPLEALNRILQLTIDVDELERFYHPDASPDRKPLRVLVKDGGGEGLKLEKFGQPVVVISPSEVEAGAAPYLQFTKIDIGEDVAAVEFEYPAEGVAGDVHFSNDGTKWSVSSVNMVER